MATHPASKQRSPPTLLIDFSNVIGRAIRVEEWTAHKKDYQIVGCEECTSRRQCEQAEEGVSETERDERGETHHQMSGNLCRFLYQMLSQVDLCPPRRNPSEKDSVWSHAYCVDQHHHASSAFPSFSFSFPCIRRHLSACECGALAWHRIGWKEILVGLCVNDLSPTVIEGIDL